MDREDAGRKTAGIGVRLRGALSGLGRRRRQPLKKAGEATQPLAVRGKPPLVPHVAGRSLPAAVPVGERPRVLIVTAFELAEARLMAVLDTVEAYAAKRHVIPVILTDCPHFEIFRRRRLAFEYLPSREQQKRFASDLSWSLYIRRRVVLLRAKWQPVGVISFGTRAPLRGALPTLASADAGGSEGESDP